MANAVSSSRRHFGFTSPGRCAKFAAGLACLALEPAPVHAALFAPRPPQLSREVKRMGSWRLQITRDPFSGAVACTLQSVDNRVWYTAGAVSFRFSFVKGVADAVYRIDNGQLFRARDDLPGLIAAGAPVNRGPPGDATMGQVWVPYERLVGADRITIEPRRDIAPRSFHFAGLVALHDYAATQGCAAASSFAR